MPDFQSIRGTPRIFDLQSAQWIDLPFDIDEDPDTLQPMLTVLQSLGGQIQTSPGTPSSRLRVVMAAMDAATRKAWKLFFDRSLAKGRNVEFVRDTGRYFWLPGDSARDVEAGQPAVSGSRYTLVTPVFDDGPDLGAIAVDPADPAGCSRTNLIENGDFVDGVVGGVPTGWTVDTLTTLAMFKSAYLPQHGGAGGMAEFNYLGAGTKTARITVDLGGLTVGTIPDDTLYVSWVWRSDRAPDSVLVYFNAFLEGSDASFATATPDTAAPPGWTRAFVAVDTSTITSTTDTELDLVFDFGNALQYAPTYITEIQVEARDFRTAFVPYSTVRTYLDGSRASDEFIRFLNGLHYQGQYPAILGSAQFGFTVGFSFIAHWQGAAIPTATVWLYGDGDNTDVDTVQALVIKTTSANLTAVLTLSDGTTVSVTKATWGVSTTDPQRVVVSVKDGDGTTDSGQVDLYVNGTLEDSATFDLHSARQGKYFFIGSKPDGSAAAAGEFRDVVLAPVYIDGTGVVIDEFDEGQRPDRNSWRCYLDPAQRGRSDRVQDNQVSLDLALIESVRVI